MADESDRPGPQHRRGDHRGGLGRLVEEDHRRREGRDSRAQEHDQHDGRPAQRASPREVTRVAREVGTEGKLGGQAQVPGVGGTWKDLTDNVNLMADNLTGQVRNIAEVTTAVAARRPVEEDHRRREGRDPRAQEHDQRDGRSAQRLRLGSDPRRPRGRHRGQARRPGAGAGRRRHLGRPHRQREPDGREPDRPGPQHRRGDHRRGARRPVQEDHRRREGRNPRAQEHHQRDGRSAQLASPPR